MNAKTTRDFYVYVYFDLDGVWRYIGMGRRRRMQSHLHRSFNRHLHNKIQKLKRLGIVMPHRKLLGRLSYEDACAAEIFWISCLGREHEGGPLWNVNAGGDGLRDPSPETRSKLRASVNALWRSAEYRAKHSAATSAAMKTHCAGPNVREKMGETTANNWKNPAYRLRQSATRKAVWSDQDLCERQRARMKRVCADPEYHAKMRARMKAVWSDPTNRASRSTALKAAWARRKQAAL